eukprot:TRINITY_DN965_c0_g1_i10.p2 TRINITY_DN965_c0_g1~~TRINITY_DN965_c0_g1_i10.p2  ORF type:complete len:164 (-),score=67.41 TRINITY_DN965_c0_g1_i10:189-680(-)
MSAWSKYIDGYLLSKQLGDGKWLQKVCEHAAILDQKGNVLAKSAGLDLKAYDYEFANDEGASEKTLVEEGKILAQVALTGESPCKAGIRVNNQKYMLVRYEPGKKLAYLSKVGGGACLMATKTVIVFGSYNTSLQMTDGKSQNPGQCNEVVEKLGDILVKNNA